VVVLTKLDLHPELLPEALAVCAELAPGVSVHALSEESRESLAPALRARVREKGRRD